MVPAPARAPAGVVGGAAERGAAPGQAGGDFDFALFPAMTSGMPWGERPTLAP
jgi:hypothetical protein